MTLDNLKIFRDIAQARSISRGAHAHGITQSAASQIIQQLEKRLGVDLLDRSQRPLALTPAGKIYYDACREILRRYDAAEARIQGLKNEAEGAVRVACIYSIGLNEMARYTAEFQKLHPRAKVKLEYLRPDKVYEAVLDEQSDLGLVSYPAGGKELKVIPWREERMALVVFPGHRLAGRPSVEPTELREEALVSFDEDLAIRKAIDRFLRGFGVAREPVLQFDNIQMIKEAVAAGSGISILPEPTVQQELAQGRLAVVPFHEANVARPVGIILRRGRRLSPVGDKFLEFLRAKA